MNKFNEFVDMPKDMKLKENDISESFEEDKLKVSDSERPKEEIVYLPEITKKSDIKYSNLEAIQNKQDGLRREKEVLEELKEKYSPEDGYEILSEVYLRDENGNIVKDPVTGEARRIDYVVIKDGKVVDSIEVTSKTSDKTEQSAKEDRIRESGGNYIKDNQGNLIEIPSDVKTRIERRD